MEVWLQCSGFDPIKLVCNKHRENMEIAGLKANSGFSIHPNDLPISWQGKNIECSFDYGGKYLLNQKGTVLVPLIKNEIITNRSTIVKENLNDLSYISKIKTAPSDLQNYWYQLEDFRLFLDELDYKIKKFDEIRQHDNLKGKENFFKRLLSNIKKKT